MPLSSHTASLSPLATSNMLNHSPNFLPQSSSPLSSCAFDSSYTLIPPPFPLSTLYNDSYCEVYRLIESDSFRRFVLAPAFESLLIRSDEETAIRLEQQKDLVEETQQAMQRAVQIIESNMERGSKKETARCDEQ